MKSTVKRLIAPLAAVIGLSAVALEAQATPAFARQMDMNCMGCHNQSIPMLNSFGRQFKLSGYTMTSGNKSMITGGDLGLSVPLAVNAGVGVKSTYIDNDAPGSRSELAIPAGSAIFISGKMAEHMGANTLLNADGIIHAQVAYSRPVGSGNAGLTYYGTMGHGAFIAVESHNTGLHKELALFDSSVRTNAVQSQGPGLGKGPATGLTAFYGGNGLTVAAGVWALGFNTVYNDKSGIPADDLGNLYRITYDAPAIAGWNLSLGAFGASGTTRGTSDDLLENMPIDWATAPWFNAAQVYDHEVKTSGFDMQLQGSIAGMDTQVVVTRVGDYELSLTDTTTLTKRKLKDTSATSLEMQVMPSSAWGVRLGYMVSTNNAATSNADTTTTSYGVNYNYADNVRFSLELSNEDPDGASDNTQTQLTTIVAF